MSKARDLADFISTGSIFTDGAIASTEITGVTADAAELNKLDGVTASTAEINKLTGVTASTTEINKLDGLNASTSELNQVVGATSALQTQLDNISVTSGSLTKTFVQNETADITLSQGITSAPVVSATKEVPQTGISSKGAWDVNSTASNYDFHDTAANVTLTPSSFINPDDISNASYASKSGSFSSQTTSISFGGIQFNNDGTKVYVCDSANDYIYQYSLTTANDISTMSYDNVYLAHGAQDSAKGLCFNSDGSKVFVLGNDVVYQHSLSTNFNVGTNTYDNVSFSMQTQDSAITDIEFSLDGTRLYGLGQYSNAVFQYNLTSGFNLTTATYANKSFSTSNSNQNESSAASFNISQDGTKAWVGGYAGNNVVQYTLSTAFELDSAASTTINLYPMGQGSSQKNIKWSKDFTRVFIQFGGDNSIKQWNVTTTTNSNLALGSGSFASTDVGKRIVGNGGDVILTSTGGAFSTTGGSAFTDSSTIAAGSWQMFGLKSAGNADGITMSSLSTGITNVNLFSKDSATYDASANIGGLYDIAFKPDGTKMFATDYSTARTHEYSLSTAWDITTASHVRIFSYSTASYGTSLSSIAFKSDGTKMYLVNWGFDYIMQVNLPTAWSLDSANLQYVKDTTGSSWGNINDPTGLMFNSDGTKVYLASNANGKIAEVNLGTAWDIHDGGNTFSTSINVSNSVPNIAPTAMQFNSDGTKLFIGNQNAVIHQYNLTTAYDLSTASYTSITKQADSAMFGFALKPDDTKFFTTQYSNKIVYQYSSASVTQPTQQYHVGVTNNSGRIDSSAFIDINSMTAAESAGTGTAHYAVSTDGRTTWSVAKGTDGVRPIVRNNSGTWQYNSESSTTGTTGAISTSTLNTTVAFDTASYQTANNIRSFFNNDGTRLYIYGYNNEDLVSYALSTAYDISTKGTHLQSVNLGQSPYNLVNGFGPIWNNDGTKLYYPDHSTVKELAVSTAYDLSTISSSASHTLTPSINGQLAGITWKPDGTRLYIVDDASTMRVHTYNLTTAWDLSTASLATTHDSSSLWSHSGNRSTSVAWADSGSQLYVLDRSNKIVRRYNCSTAYDVSTATYSGTSNDIALPTSGTDPCSITIDNNDGVLLVADYGAQDTYQYIPTSTTSPAYVTTPTWTDGTVNDELYTLQQALSVTMNRMDKTQLDAVADANHFSTGSSLDLMIALRMDTAASTLPTSDGVTLNYDAAALNEGAVLGTDYDFFFPSSTKVQIKSLAAQNLKVRVV